MTLTESKIDLASLNSADKAAAIEFLLPTLSKGSQGITKTPGVCGGDACIDETRLPVWLFVSLRSLFFASSQESTIASSNRVFK